MKLRDLYRGEYWQLALETEQWADLFVASAGLGLQDLNSKGPGYGATFATGSPDSVLRLSQHEQIGNVRCNWWDGLASNGLGIKSWTKKTSDVVLVALSSSYQQALSTDLKNLAQSGKKIIVLSGSMPVAQLRGEKNIHHVATGQWLRMVLGGSTPCVGIKFVLHLLQKDIWRSVAQVNSEIEQMKQSYLAGSVESLPVFNRTTRTDIQVKRWITETLRANSTPDKSSTKSNLLREYRSSGFACEQKRFGILFDEVVGK